MWVSGVGGPKLLFITVFMAYFTTFLLTIFGKFMLKVPSLWGRWVGPQVWDFIPNKTYFGGNSSISENTQVEVLDKLQMQ